MRASTKKFSSLSRHIDKKALGMSANLSTTFLRSKAIKNLFISLSFVFTTSILWPSFANSDDGHSASHGVKVEVLANSTKMWNGRVLPSYPKGQPNIKILRIQVPSGVTLPWHYHPVINAAVILQGTLELKLKDGTRKTYQQGDALIEVVNTIHEGKALGATDVDLIVFYAGEKDVPTTVLIDPQNNQ
ncbi:cupin domain-containing protein [Synechococcus sp. UW179B]|jgi:quercetin dioxygenase-like cupin family protein|uniref:cupin domain-containing protein n=1 Tax=Synechococcus sp. UW179B TaxID=2575516 RepID=UPI001FCB2B3B|nr:cupin domain-containing protein [Synechococcus sp. UW179B]